MSILATPPLNGHAPRPCLAPTNRETRCGVLHGAILAYEAAQYAAACAQEGGITSPWWHAADELLEATRTALVRAVLVASGCDVHPEKVERPGFRWETSGARTDDHAVMIAPHVDEDGRTDYRFELAGVIVLGWDHMADLQDLGHALEMAQAAAEAEARAEGTAAA